MEQDMTLLEFVVMSLMVFIPVGALYYAFIIRWPLPKDSKKSKP